MKILFASAEITPFSKVGGLADVAGALPRQLARSGQQVQVISPLYSQVDRDKNGIELTEVKGVIRLGILSHPYQLAKSALPNEAGLEYFFIFNQHFFGRQGIYTDSTGEGYPDNNARFIFFQKAVADLMEKGILKPDILHVNDHHTALLPLLVRNTGYDKPALLTVHNFEYQGDFSSAEASMFESETRAELDKLYPADSETYNALEIGIRLSAHTNTVSPNYARELLEDGSLSFGLQETLTAAGKGFSGILNGADYSYWNPATDDKIAGNYTPDSIGGKLANKQALLERLEMPFDDAVPVIGSVSRLVHGKGFDTILEIMKSLVKMPVQLVFLGTGYQLFQDQLAEWAEKYPDKISFTAAYDEPLAHLIEAGSDMFLMPSRFEPCGLNQIYSLKYGTPPIVHRTGGLADTVQDWDGSKGNGFVFNNHGAENLLRTIKRAVNVYRVDNAEWPVLVGNAMAADYSWDKSAQEYIDLYNRIAGKGKKNG